MMERDHGIPFKRVSYFGIEDMSAALYEAAKFFKEDPTIMERAQQLVREELGLIYPRYRRFKEKLIGKKGGDLCRGLLQGLFAQCASCGMLGMETALSDRKQATRKITSSFRNLRSRHHHRG